MKHLYLAFTLLLAVATTSAQETVQDLSKKAGKGFLYSAANDGGGYKLTYKIPGDKKKEEIFYEVYSFDKNLRFVKDEEVAEPKQSKEDKPDITVSGFNASVGGCSCFDILSMKLKFNKFTATKSWDYQKQRYITQKILTSETIKPKNENGKLRGYASFSGDDESLFVLAGNDSKTNKHGTDFFILTINADYEIATKPLDISGSQSLVYSDQLANGDVVLVFAPKKGEPDLSDYTYIRYNTKADMKEKEIGRAHV